MKSRILCALAVLIMGAVGMTGNVAAQYGTVAASAIPSNPWSRVGQEIVVTVRMDVAGVELGSFGGDLKWDPTVLQYVGNSGIQAGFTGVVNANNAAAGRIIYNGVKVYGATGRNDVLTVMFTAIKPGRTPLDLTYTAMAAARTFGNLLPVLTVKDGLVLVRWR